MIWNAFAIAVREIRRNLTRAFLTVLGIIIGVAAVITMVTLGDATTNAVKEQISSLGSNLLMLRPGAGFGPRAASAGVNQLIRLGQASMVTNAQEVITDLTTHAYSATAAAAQLDESFIPGPVRSAQSHVPGPPAPAAAPRR